jgi:hypothetical protein
LFAALKHRADKSVVADSKSAMRLAARGADESEGASAVEVSVPSHFRHVHAPAPRAKAHSTHAVALDEQPASTETAEESSNSAPAAKTQHSATPSRSVQHAADESDVSLIGDIDAPPSPAAQSAHAPTSSTGHGASRHDAADHAISTPPAPTPDSISAASNHAAAPANPNASVQPTLEAAAQPAPPAISQSAESASARWPLVPTALPAAPGPATAQAAADPSNANGSALTIVPGRPDSISATIAATAGHVPATASQAPVDPAVARSMDPPAAPMAPPANVYGVFQDRPHTPPAPQPAANPLESLDRTKVMSFQFRNAPWSLVLAKFAAATGLELRMQAMPDGTFNRWDAGRYTPSQTLTILNSELAKLGCQATVVGSALCIVPISPSGGVTPASASSLVIAPGASSRSQPQFPAAAANPWSSSAAR